MSWWMKLCHLKLCRILRIPGKLKSDKVASTTVINSYVNIFPKMAFFWFDFSYQTFSYQHLSTDTNFLQLSLIVTETQTFRQ